MRRTEFRFLISTGFARKGEGSSVFNISKYVSMHVEVLRCAGTGKTRSHKVSATVSACLVTPTT